jgi:hypothetical protein
MAGFDTSNEPLVVVYEAPDQFRADLAAEALEAAGIPVMVQADRAATIYDGLDLSMVGRYARLLVHESRAEAAQQIITEVMQDYEAGNFALPEEPETE